MAGRGPAPKDPSKRARRNVDPVALRVITAERTAQPELPTFQIESDGELVDFTWPAATQDWWRIWAESPLSADFTDIDWSYLMDTALLHARYWHGDHKVAGEIRLREAQFGATPADRARLRITLVQADEAESHKGKPAASSRDRYKGLRAAGS